MMLYNTMAITIAEWLDLFVEEFGRKIKQVRKITLRAYWIFGL